MGKTEKYEISKEALWAISNATSGGSETQIAFLVNQGVIPPLCTFLKHVQQKKILMVALEGIENILKVGKAKAVHDGSGRNQFAEYVEESGGVDYLEQLQSNDSIPDGIYEKAATMVKEYFNGEEELGGGSTMETENENDNGNGNQFGSGNSNGFANNNQNRMQNNNNNNGSNGNGNGQQDSNMFAFGSNNNSGGFHF